MGTLITSLCFALLLFPPNVQIQQAVSIRLPVHEHISPPPVSPFTSSSLSSPLLADTGRKKHQLYPGCGWPGHYSTCEPQPAGPPGLGRVQACPAGQTQHRFPEAAACAVGPAEVPSCNRPSDWVGTRAAPTPGMLEETGLEIKVSPYCLPPPPRAVYLLEYFCSEDCKHNVLKKS